MVRWTQPRRDEDGGPALVTDQVDNDDVRGLAAGQPPRATGAGQKGSEDESIR
jgi:hypothetical protein